MQEWLRTRDVVVAQHKHSLAKAKANMKKYADKKHRPSRSWGRRRGVGYAPPISTTLYSSCFSRSSSPARETVSHTTCHCHCWPQKKVQGRPTHTTCHCHCWPQKKVQYFNLRISLKTRVLLRNAQLVKQVLVQWANLAVSEATWEDWDPYNSNFLPLTLRKRLFSMGAVLLGKRLALMELMMTTRQRIQWKIKQMMKGSLIHKMWNWGATWERRNITENMGMSKDTRGIRGVRWGGGVGIGENCPLIFCFGFTTLSHGMQYFLNNICLLQYGSCECTEQTLSVKESAFHYRLDYMALKEERITE